MPKRQIAAVEGQYYHVLNRGALKMTLFYSPNAYEIFVALLTKYAEKYKIKVVAMCLMPNHFHFLLRIEKGGDLAKMMSCLCGVFSRKVNKFMRRTGTIFEGRFHCLHVKNESYFMQLCSYIHLNPVKAGLAQDPSGWTCSTYLETTGRRSLIECAHDVISAVFGSVQQYVDFVAEQAKNLQVRDQDLARDLARMHIV